MNQTDIENMSTPERVLELIKVSSVLADRAKATEKTASANSHDCSQLIPGVVEACIASGDVRTEQKAQFADALGSHTSTLRMLHKMATLKQAANTPATTIGSHVAAPGRQEKTASNGRHADRTAEAPSLTRLREALKIN